MKHKLFIVWPFVGRVCQPPIYLHSLVERGRSSVARSTFISHLLRHFRKARVSKPLQSKNGEMVSLTLPVAQAHLKNQIR